MPSGAKKRKAAKRRKEKQEKGTGKDKERGSIPHPPVSPTNDPLPSLPPPPETQGNGNEDRMPHDNGWESESGVFETPSETPFATPLSQANHPLAEEAGDETPGSQRVAVDSAAESSENGNGESDESACRPDERAGDHVAELQMEMVAAAADDIVAAPPYDLSVEIVRSQKGEFCDAEGAEGTEMEKPTEESVIAVEQIVFTREEAKQQKEAPDEILTESPVVISLKRELKLAPLPVKDEIKKQPSYKREGKVVPPPGEDEVKEEPSYEREVKVVPPSDEGDVKNRPSYECEVPQLDENEVEEQPSYEHDTNVVPLPDKDEVKERPYHEREGKLAALLNEDKVKEQPYHEREGKLAVLLNEDKVKEQPYHEREGKVAALPDEDKVKKQPSHEREVKVVPLLDEDVTGEKLCESRKASQGSRRAETVPSTEVAPCAPAVVHHARWWNCCGLLDVLVGSER